MLARINDLFADEDFTRAEQQSWVEGLVTVLSDNDTIRGQAKANTKKQFVESPDLNDAVTDAVISKQDSHNRMTETFFSDDQKKAQLVKLLGELVHETLSASA